jgi:hypothetical protein
MAFRIHDKLFLDLTNLLGGVKFSDGSKVKSAFKADRKRFWYLVKRYLWFTYPDCAADITITRFSLTGFEDFIGIFELWEKTDQRIPLRLFHQRWIEGRV